MIHIDPKFVVPRNDISGWISSDYGENVDNYRDHKFICQSIIMFHKYMTTDFEHDHVMQLIPGDAETFVSADSVDDCRAAMCPTGFLNSLSPNGMPLID